MKSDKWKRLQDEESCQKEIDSIVEQQIQQYESAIEKVKSSSKVGEVIGENLHEEKVIGNKDSDVEQSAEVSRNKLSLRKKKISFFVVGIAGIIVIIGMLIHNFDQGTVLDRPLIYIKDKMLKAVPSSKSGDVVLDEQTKLQGVMGTGHWYSSLYNNETSEELIQTSKNGEWTYYPTDVVTQDGGEVLNYTLNRIHRGDMEGTIVERDVAHYCLLNEEDVIYQTNKMGKLYGMIGANKYEYGTSPNENNIVKYDVSEDETMVLWLEMTKQGISLCVQDSMQSDSPRILANNVNAFGILYTEDFGSIFYTGLDGIYGIYNYESPIMIETEAELINLCKMDDQAGIYYTKANKESPTVGIDGTIPEAIQTRIENEYGMVNELYYYDVQQGSQLLDSYYLSSINYMSEEGPTLSYRSFDSTQAVFDFSGYSDEGEMIAAYEEYIWGNSIFKIAFMERVIYNGKNYRWIYPNQEAGKLYLYEYPITILGQSNTESIQVDEYDYQTGILTKTYDMDGKMIGTERFIEGKFLVLEEKGNSSSIIYTNGPLVGDLYYESTLLVKKYLSGSGSELIDESGFMCLTDYDALTQSSVLKKVTGEYTDSMSEEIIAENVLEYQVLGKNQYALVVGSGYKREKSELYLYCDGKKIRLEQGNVSLNIKNAFAY